MKPHAVHAASRPGLGLAALLVALAMSLAGAPIPAGAAEAATVSARKDKHGQSFPPLPAAAREALPAEVQRALAELAPALRELRFPSAAVQRIGAAGDARLAWVLYDLLRFAGRDTFGEIVSAFERLTGAPLPSEPITAMGDRLLAWDLPAPPGYREVKRDLFLLIEPAWAPFFADADSAIDWRQVGWGGVFIDDRLDATQGETCPRGCIPALDQPKVTPASQGGWYPDNAIVFGIVVNGQARAYPKNIMEVHEMVNDTLGGRRIGIPYCTLCLSAQAYLTDRASGFEPLLRTSGLLARSNKFMYDRRTWSAVDTFTGRAISGPLHKAGVTLPQTTVVTSTWGAWRKAYPRTTIVAKDGGVGRSYPLEPLQGRDNNGPIFPVGDVDARLPVHEVVLGVTAPDGRPLAFPRVAVQMALRAGEPVRMGGVEVRRDAGGLRAFAGKTELPSHEAFWFAWSQFKPGTGLWLRGGRE
ncbi:MAG: DUF3179 domain-containing protein [Burkholderiales bacterium]|nr:DUF3179 domain-containing protein [Burkholderiales bacterium]